MFSNIRNAIAALIATKPERTVIKQPDHLKTIQFQPNVKVMSSHDRTTTKRTTNFEGITGTLSCEAIKGLSSDMLRKQLMGKLVYSYIAKGFNEFSKAQGRYTSGEALDKALNNAAEAVSQSASLGYPVDFDEDRWSFLLTTGVPAKLSEAHAKMVADITGQDVTTLIKSRDEKRKTKFLSNQEMLRNYLLAVEGYEPIANHETGEFPEATVILSGASTMSGLASTIEFVTTWNDEIRMAAELMLIQHDQKVIERELGRSTRREESQAPDYVTNIDRLLLDANGLAAGAASGK